MMPDWNKDPRIKDLIIQTIKVFEVPAICNHCKTRQTMTVRWIRRLDRTVTVQVEGKVCSVCNKVPADWYVNQQEVLAEYKEEWGPLAPEVKAAIGRGLR